MSESANQPESGPSMSFGTAVTTVFRKYAEFGGRAKRSEFWWFILFAALVSAALSALNLTTPEGVLAIGTSLASVWGIVTLLPTLAVMVRRLRDTGKEWQNVFWLLIPIAGLIIIAVFASQPTKSE